MIDENSWGIDTAGFKRDIEILLENVKSIYNGISKRAHTLSRGITVSQLRE
jgi:hypothetical protein